MASKNKKLRSGYTTGACAAAAAKAAAMLLLSAEVQTLRQAQGDNVMASLSNHQGYNVKEVEIPFPDGSRHKFKIQDSRFKDGIAAASTIKDAGDDPDVTNGAEIVATVKVRSEKLEVLIIKGGKGVGIVTKPGLPIPVGEPAINPVPQKMIKEAVLEAVQGFKGPLLGESPKATRVQGLEITISVPDGEKLAKKTLNSRLGIINGISILGTTCIVKPISSEAWTATITSSMNVARALGRNEIVLSVGRASELAHIKKYNLPEDCYVMMGDYLEFSLLEAKKHEFKKIHLCAQWAKMLKIAMATPQTHVRHGAIDIEKAVEFLKKLDNVSQFTGHEFNTAREIFDFINSRLSTHKSGLLKKVCEAAKRYAEKISPGIPVNAHLVSYEGDIIESSE